MPTRGRLPHLGQARTDIFSPCLGRGQGHGCPGRTGPSSRQPLRHAGPAPYARLPPASPRPGRAALGPGSGWERGRGPQHGSARLGTGLRAARPGLPLAAAAVPGGDGGAVPSAGRPPCPPAGTAVLPCGWLGRWVERNPQRPVQDSAPPPAAGWQRVCAACSR